MQENAKIITVSVISELTTDQRVIRICTTLANMGFRVRVIARRLKGALPLDKYPFESERIGCHFRKGFLQYAEFNLKLFFQLLFTKTDYLLANDLDTLLPNFIVSKLRNKHLFYDTHEYFTGVPELTQSPAKRKFWKKIEDFILPKLKTVYTVNHSVKNLYEKEYPIRLDVVRNVPITVPETAKPLPETWKGKTILMMQGMGINPGRGGLEALEMMKYLPDNYLLVYIGGGLLWKTIGEKVSEWQLESKVEMYPKMSPTELRQYTLLAHMGLSLDGFDNINFRVNLPNKVFDYIHAGVPIAAHPILEIVNIIEQYNCGFCFTTIQPKEMAAQIVELFDNKNLYMLYKKNTSLAKMELCWEQESKVIVQIYTSFL